MGPLAAVIFNRCTVSAHSRLATSAPEKGSVPVFHTGFYSYPYANSRESSFTVLRAGVPDRTPPSPGIVGSSNITDPRVGPSPPDQFAFSA